MIVQHTRRNVWDTRAVMLSMFASFNLAMFPDLGLWMAAPALALVPLISRTRASSLELGLPVHARTIFVARLLWSFVLMLVPWLVWLVSMGAHGKSKWPMSVAFEALAIAALAVIAPSLIRVRELRSPPVWLVLLQWSAIAGGSALVIRLLPPAIAVAALTAAVLIAFGVAWQSMPESFVASVPMQSASVASTRPGVEKRAEAGIMYPWRVLLRALCSPMVLFFWVLAFFMGTVNNGGNSMLFVLMSITGGMEQLRRRSWWMYGLPFSTRQRLMVMLIPGVLVPVALIGVGTLFALPGLGGRQSMGVGAPLTNDESGYYTSPTRVPLEYWPVTGDPAPVITAPWGEQTRAYTFHIPGVSYYNPYSSRKTSSPRFVAWQFARATTAVYGHPIAQAEYDANIERLPPRLTSASWRMKILNMGALLLLALAHALWGEAARSHRLTRWPHAPLVAAYLTGIPPLAAIIFDMYYGGRQGTGVIIPRVEAALLRMSAALPQNLFVVIALVTVSIGTMYWLLERQFGQTESVDLRTLAPRPRP